GPNEKGARPPVEAGLCQRRLFEEDRCRSTRDDQRSGRIREQRRGARSGRALEQRLRRVGYGRCTRQIAPRLLARCPPGGDIGYVSRAGLRWTVNAVMLDAD